MRFGNSIVNTKYLRDIELVKPLFTSSWKVRFNYHGMDQVSGGAFWFGGSNSYQTWTFDTRKDADDFMKEVETRLKTESNEWVFEN